jgi:hypothetical protein
MKEVLRNFNNTVYLCIALFIYSDVVRRNTDILRH